MRLVLQLRAWGMIYPVNAPIELTLSDPEDGGPTKLKLDFREETDISVDDDADTIVRVGGNAWCVDESLPDIIKMIAAVIAVDRG